MCTLLLGRDVTVTGEILIAANRDEDPGRPSELPGVLNDAPRLLGGRDRVAGGTWLAVRPETPSVTMLLNRPPVAGAAAAARSRGLLVLDVASASDPLAAARAAVLSGHYGPCTLVFARPTRAGGPRFAGRMEAPGWRTITHAEMDDANEPRTAWLERSWRGSRSTGTESTSSSSRRYSGTTAATAARPVHHAGRMPTVSASLIALSRERASISTPRAACGTARDDQRGGEALRRAGRPAPPGPPSGGRP
jgi:hypothetical protein